MFSLNSARDVDQHYLYADPDPGIFLFANPDSEEDFIWKLWRNCSVLILFALEAQNKILYNDTGRYWLVESGIAAMGYRHHFGFKPRGWPI